MDRPEIEEWPEEDQNVGGDPSEVVHHDIYTVANIITMLRLLLIPIFFSALISENPNSDTFALVLFVVAASTDFLDGMIARRTGTVTVLGRMIDPLVDRLLIAAGVVGLYMVGRLSLWILVLLMARDVYLLWGSWRLEKHHMRLAVTMAGKVTTVVLLTSFAFLIWDRPTLTLPLLGEMLLGTPILYLGLVMSLMTAADYYRRGKAAVARKAGRDGSR